LYEYGIALNVGKKSLRQGMAQYLASDNDTLPPIVKRLLSTLQVQWLETDKHHKAAVYIGATPKHHSSGGKSIMVGIDKKGGDRKLRSVIYLGALSYIF
jgi:hypothetical protein